MIKKYWLNNEGKTIRVGVIAIGCAITDFMVKNRDGKWLNIVLNHDDLESYKVNKNYYGTVVGRTAGRIDKGQFDLNGITYQLEKNDGNNNLHGGSSGMAHKAWELVSVSESCLKWEIVDQAGEFPGNLKVQVVYTLKNNKLVINYTCQSDSDTLVNLTNHTYFNLEGKGSAKVNEHELMVDADYYYETDHENLPLKTKTAVESSNYDYRTPKTLGNICEAELDNPFILNEKDSICSLYSNRTGIRLITRTNYPAVVIYSGNYLERPYSGICFETQFVPNGINMTKVNPGILRKNEVFRQETTYEIQHK